MGLDNIKPKVATVQLDIERPMRFTFASMAYLAEKFGDVSTAMDIFSKRSAAMTADSINVVIDFAFACLMPDGPKLTRSDVANLLDLVTFRPVLEGITAALSSSMPERPKEELADPDFPVSGTPSAEGSVEPTGPGSTS